MNEKTSRVNLGEGLIYFSYRLTKKIQSRKARKTIAFTMEPSKPALKKK